jgi:hypothetical protein
MIQSRHRFPEERRRTAPSRLPTAFATHSHAPGSRAQTEPLAALVAIATFCVAVSMYAGVHTNVIPAVGEERQLAEPTAEQIWNDISTKGVYADDSLDVEQSTLPNGYYVAITVTTVSATGHRQTVAHRIYGPAAEVVSESVRPPDDAEKHERSISIKRRPADVQPGTLTVEVWE